MNKRVLSIFLIAIIALGGMIFYAARKKDNTSSSRTVDYTQSSVSDDHFRGNPEKKLVLVEYGDFQCPSCKSWYPIIKELEKEYDDRVTFVFRNFPLKEIHINAFAGARAAEAANIQGKFWEMHDMLYERQDTWAASGKPAQSILEEYAKELGLDVDKFKSDYLSQAVSDRINSDIKSAKDQKFSGTPTFSIDGKELAASDIYENSRASKTKMLAMLSQKYKEKTGTELGAAKASVSVSTDSTATTTTVTDQTNTVDPSAAVKQ